MIWDFICRIFRFVGTFIVDLLVPLFYTVYSISELYARDRLIGVGGHIFLTFAAIYKCYTF